MGFSFYNQRMMHLLHYIVWCFGISLAALRKSTVSSLLRSSEFEGFYFWNIDYRLLLALSGYVVNGLFWVVETLEYHLNTYSNPYAAGALFGQYKVMPTSGEMTETVAHGSHLGVLSEGYPMNNNTTGFRWFSKIWRPCALYGGSLSIGRAKDLETVEMDALRCSSVRAILKQWLCST